MRYETIITDKDRVNTVIGKVFKRFYGTRKVMMAKAKEIS
jgi:hypothetical protein